MPRINPLLKARAEATQDDKVTASSSPHPDLAQYQAQMKVDLGRLKEKKNIDDKATLKAELIKTYAPFIEQYVDEGHKYPNDVAVQIMIWLFDTGETINAIHLGLHLVKQGCHITPKSFSRDLETVICDEVYDALIKQVKDKQFDEAVYSLLTQLLQTIQQDKWSLAPPVHSKLLALAAKIAKGLGRWEACVTHCTQAMAVNPDRHGVKKLLAEAVKKAPLAGAGEDASA